MHHGCKRTSRLEGDSISFSSVLFFYLFLRLHFFFGVGASLAPAIIALVMLLCSTDRQLFISYYAIAALSLLTAILPILIRSPKVKKEEKEKQTTDEHSSITIAKGSIELFLVFPLNIVLMFLFPSLQQSPSQRVKN